MSQAFNNKNYPVESNQAKWISELVDFFVESIVRLSVSDNHVTVMCCNINYLHSILLLDQNSYYGYHTTEIKYN